MTRFLMTRRLPSRPCSIARHVNLGQGLRYADLSVRDFVADCTSCPCVQDGLARLAVLLFHGTESYGNLRGWRKRMDLHRHLQKFEDDNKALQPRGI